MYSAIDLSKYIISKCIADGSPISNLQLQKILYYIQKDFLSRGKPAFPDDIEAWQFGPVVPNVYYHYCGYGAMPITIPISKEKIINIPVSDKDHIDVIIDTKRILNPWDMVAETHKANGAWAKTYKSGLGNHSTIPLDLIRTVG